MLCRLMKGIQGCPLQWYDWIAILLDLPHPNCNGLVGENVRDGFGGRVINQPAIKSEAATVVLLSVELIPLSCLHS